MDRNRFIQCMKSNIELSGKERRRIIRRSVESQPWKLKCTIAMEEFAELTQAISKQIRGYDNRIGLLEEMADAYICRDPLWKYEQHKDWYEKFFEIVDAAHVNTELHTSLHAVQGVSYSHFDRVVYHLHSLEQIYSIKRENCSIVRIVFVVTEDFTEDMINRIAVFCANSEDIDELSFRQMVDNHYRETYYCHDYLKAGHKKLWWYIEQNDYNLYYCQNHVYTEYKNIGGDSNG